MKKKIFQQQTRIISRDKIKGGYFKLALKCPQIASLARPGQFVMLRLSDSYKPLLRRPFSIHRIVHSPQSIVHSKRKKLEANGVEILYKVVGKGTEILSEKEPGEYLDVLGPLGNGFSILDSRYSILVGGGMGIAPLLFLAQRLIERKAQRAKRLPCRQAGKALVLIGANTKKEILSQKEFAKLGCSVKISTDDGSAGFKGKVTDLLRQLLSTTDCRLWTIYACGPKPMLKEVSLISGQCGVPSQISLEEYIACGLGVCLGCMVNTRRGFQAVCREGPVFDSRIIKW